MTPNADTAFGRTQLKCSFAVNGNKLERTKMTLKIGDDVNKTNMNKLILDRKEN